MSDQVIFAKEQVKKIREALSLNRDDLMGNRHMSLSGELEYTNEALKIINYKTTGDTE
jgi:hypothetical protein